MVAFCFCGTDSAAPEGRMLTNSIRAKDPSKKIQREVTAPAKMKNARCVPRHAVSMGCLPLPLRVGSGPCASRKLMQLWLVYIVHRSTPTAHSHVRMSAHAASPKVKVCDRRAYRVVQGAQHVYCRRYFPFLNKTHNQHRRTAPWSNY